MVPLMVVEMTGVKDSNTAGAVGVPKASGMNNTKVVGKATVKVEE